MGSYFFCAGLRLVSAQSADSRIASRKSPGVKKNEFCRHGPERTDLLVSGGFVRSTYYDPTFVARAIISAQSGHGPWPKRAANRQVSTPPSPQKDHTKLPEFFTVNAVHACARFQAS